MTTVVLPPPLGAVPEPDACVAARAAGGPARMATALRSTGVAVSDVAGDARSAGAPGDWQGLSAESAGRALAGLGADADAAVAALERAVRGLDAYDDEVARAARTWDRLDDARATFDADLADLRRRVGVDGAGAEPAAVAALRAEAERLTRRREALVADLAAVDADVVAAEDRLVRVLASVDTAQEAAGAATDPGRPDVDALTAEVRGLAGDPGAVHRWWDGLSAAERAALLLGAASLLGRLDGIPTGARDTANRATLARDLEHLGGLQELGVDLTDAQERALAHARHVQDALALGEATLDPHTGLPLDTHLLLYDPEAFGGDGAGAVAYGDPDTADDTVVLVPGLTSDLSSLDGLGEDALRVLEAAGPEASTAVVGWIGYDAPSGAPTSPGDLLDLAGVVGEGSAEAGGHALVDLVDGLRATDEGAASNLTVIGHSYGSTTVAHAGVDGLDEDAMVLLGSPGAGEGVDHAADLGVPVGGLYVGAADLDPVTWLGGDGPLGLGPDPAQADFGGTRIVVDPGEPFGPGGIGSTGFDRNHDSYYDPGSSSLDNLGSIVGGDGAVSTEPGRDQAARDLLEDWLARQGADAVHEHVVDPFRDALDGLLDRLGVGG